MFTLGDAVVPHVKRALNLMQPMLSDPDSFARAEGREIIGNLAKAAGWKAIAVALKDDVDDDNEEIRGLTARTMAIVGQRLGVDQIVPFLRAVCASQKSWKARHTGAKLIYELCMVLGVGMRQHLRDMLSCIAPINMPSLLRDEQGRVKLQAAQSVAALAEAVTPYGIEEFNVIVGTVREEVMLNRGKVLTAFVRAMGCLIALMAPRDALDYSTSILDVVVRSCNAPDEELRVAILKVLQQIVSHEGVDTNFVREQLSALFFGAFWGSSFSMDRRSMRQLVETTVDIGKKIGSSDVVFHLIGRVKDRESDAFQRNALEAVQRVIERCGTLDIHSNQVQELLEAVVEALGADDLGTNLNVVNTVVAVTRSLGARAASHFGQLLGLVQRRLTNNQYPQVRRQSAQVIERTAKPIVDAGQAALLPQVSQTLTERLSGSSAEIDPTALSSIIRALRAVVQALPSPTDFKPSIGRLLSDLIPVVKNPDEAVQEDTILLLGVIARLANAHPEVAIAIFASNCYSLQRMASSTS